MNLYSSRILLTVIGQRAPLLGLKGAPSVDPEQRDKITIGGGPDTADEVRMAAMKMHLHLRLTEATRRQ